MKEINDMELDDLIMASVEREQKLETLNQAIVKDVQRRARREWAKRWGRVIVYSFGLPLVLAGFAFGVLRLFTSGQLFCVRACILISVATMAWVTARSIRNISIANM